MVAEVLVHQAVLWIWGVSCHVVVVAYDVEVADSLDFCVDGLQIGTVCLLPVLSGEESAVVWVGVGHIVC